MTALIMIVMSVMFSSAAWAEREPLSVPSGTPILVDGTMEDLEWADALKIEIDEAYQLWLKHAEGELLVGIRSPAMITGNILIQTASSTVQIMHASAALGTAIYVRQDDIWQLSQNFVWQCRDYSDSARAVAARDHFLENEGWLASIGYQGKRTDMEYRIKVSSDTYAFLAVVIPGTYPYTPVVWPVDVSQSIFPGPIRDSADIHPETWPILRLEVPQ